ncbi:MAG: MBL fold metallo-hydrolase [Clostridiales bacterium]|nr:MBL fold metallo-hydrolase [Clostridiales bacterium]
MTDFSVYTLASSSRGNCTYVRCNDTELLIDAGISMRRIETALCGLGTKLSNISAIFITHEHSDHVSALETISKKYPIPVHFVEASAMAFLGTEKTRTVGQAAVIHPPIYCECVGSLKVQSFVTPHDSAGSVGFVVSDGTAEHTFALATDIGCITESIETALIGVQNVILESNHDENMLLCGAYPYQLKRRILSRTGHLSNEAASKFALQLANNGMKRLLLAHLSPDNNHPVLALRTAELALENTDAMVNVAAMSEPTQLV